MNLEKSDVLNNALLMASRQLEIAGYCPNETNNRLSAYYYKCPIGINLGVQGCHNCIKTYFLKQQYKQLQYERVSKVFLEKKAEIINQDIFDYGEDDCKYIIEQYALSQTACELEIDKKKIAEILGLNKARE